MLYSVAVAFTERLMGTLHDNSFIKPDSDHGPLHFIALPELVLFDW